MIWSPKLLSRSPWRFSVFALCLLLLAGCGLESRVDDTSADGRHARDAIASEERSAFSSFEFAKQVATPTPTMLFFSKRKADKKAQLISVGWYEYSLEKDGKVEFVFEDRDKIIRRRSSSYSPEKICDLYDIVYGKPGHRIDAPDDVKKYQDADITTDASIASDFQKQDFKKLLSQITGAAYYDLEVVEPGFIALTEEKINFRIIWGVNGGRVVFIRLATKNGSQDFIRLEQTPEIEAALSPTPGAAHREDAAPGGLDYDAWSKIAIGMSIAVIVGQSIPRPVFTGLAHRRAKPLFDFGDGHPDRDLRVDWSGSVVAHDGRTMVRRDGRKVPGRHAAHPRYA